MKSFKKTGISNALDGTEDEAIYEDDSDVQDEDDLRHKKVIEKKNNNLNVNSDSEEEFCGFYDE